jgi:3-oxoacyl-[acyl-carrier-protein] synthase II
VSAAIDAHTDAGELNADPARCAVIASTGIGGLNTLQENCEIFFDRGPSRVSPFFVPMMMPNATAGHIGMQWGWRGPNFCIATACAAGANAIGEGARLIRDGDADVVVAGGTEAAIHQLNMAAFSQMQALSTRNDEPERASRPYDKGRDGFVLGEGAGVVVLESAEHAKARGAKIYAEIASAGITSDAHHIAAPDPVGRGAARAMHLALAAAGVSASDIVHINAHATSTPAGDVAEAQAMASVLGEDSKACVSATKSMTGHLLGAAGAIETIATVLALHNRLAPPTMNLEDPDDDVHIDVVRGEPRKLPDGPIAALNNSFGFGGHNVALVVKSVEQ